MSVLSTLVVTVGEEAFLPLACGAVLPAPWGKPVMVHFYSTTTSSKLDLGAWSHHMRHPRVVTRCKSAMHILGLRSCHPQLDLDTPKGSFLRQVLEMMWVTVALWGSMSSQHPTFTDTKGLIKRMRGCGYKILCVVKKSISPCCRQA